MSVRNSSGSTDSVEEVQDSSLCVVCQHPAVGKGPYSAKQMCQRHIQNDGEKVLQLERDVNEQLRLYSEVASAAAFSQERLELQQRIQDIESEIAEQIRMLKEYRNRTIYQLTARQSSLQKCAADLEDLASYREEVREALDEGDLTKVLDIVQGMHVSIPDLKRDFELNARLRAESDGSELRRLLELHECTGHMMAGVDARQDAMPATIDKFYISHAVELKCAISWLAVCTVTMEFRADPSGRVVPATLTAVDSVPLPQPCLIAAAVRGSDHLVVLSLTGGVKLRSHCGRVNWDSAIWGLHCHNHLVCIAQELSVIVADLSGHFVREILVSNIAGFGRVKGICGNSSCMFVSSGNKIAAFSYAGNLNTVITLGQLPYADLHGLAIHRNCLLAIDRNRNRVHKVCVDTHRILSTLPDQQSGLTRFRWPRDVAVDSRGRVFVSDCKTESVHAMGGDNGSLLWTLGKSGERGCGGNRLNMPLGLTVVRGGQRDHLVVSDGANQRLLVASLF